METILDLKDGPTFEFFHFWHLRPFGADFAIYLQKQGIFRVGPLAFIDIWLQNIDPPLTTLSCNSPGKKRGNFDPIFCTKFIDQLS